MSAPDFGFRPSEDTEFEWISPLGVESSLDRLASYLDRSDDPGRVLDVGCGDGTLLAELAGRYPGRTFHGIDPDAGAISQARDRIADRPNASVEEATLDPSAHDPAFLYAVNVIQDTPDPAAMVEDLHATLADGGLALVTTPPVGVERTFADPAPRYDHATLTEDEDRLTVDMGSIRAEVDYGEDLAEQRLYAVGDDEETLVVSQYVIRRDSFERFCREAGFDIVETDELACNPTGIAYVLDLYGFTAEAEEWRDLTERWRANPDSVVDELPTVPALLLRA